MAALIRGRRIRQPRWIGSWALAAPLVLIALTGCGGPEKGPGVASAETGSETPSATASPSRSPSGDVVKFAECMKKHGVDVEVENGGDGKIGIRGKATGGSGDSMQKAQEACRELAPGGGGGGGGGQPISKQDQEKFLSFARCMREHGIPMQDPTFEGGGVKLQIGAGSDKRPEVGDQKVEEAQKACQSNLPQDVRGGQPGGGAA
jgi:hypothetical protein